ncbi:MAG TPA: GAF domain-containing protein [Ilumatobacter sp.]|nr:GAF domain-containing protein [Ilumatobacter sp.]
MPAHREWLGGLLARHGGVAGTVHLDDGGDLELVAAVNIPPHLEQIVRRVPHGKGMAGLAQTERRPVQTCNLQTDTDGPFNPAAREAGGAAAVAIPLIVADRVAAVVGLTFEFEGQIGAELLAQLEAEVASLPLDAV